ncbi:MAG: hypothetical protein KIT58_10925, partial [Planctomycetota bacterium]|nr:hypothetical protein [Planctomycetota bacterium]
MILGGAVALGWGGVWAQEGAPTPDALADEQQNVLSGLERLDEKMRTLADRLRERQPEQAARLEAAYQAVRERLVREDMAKVVDLLRQRNTLAALEGQESVKKHLEVLLQILEGQRRGEQVKDVDEKRAQLMADIAQIRDLEQRQEQLNRELQGEGERKQQLESVEQARAQVQKLREAQEQLRQGRMDRQRQVQLAERVARAADQARALEQAQQQVGRGETGAEGAEAMARAAADLDQVSALQESGARGAARRPPP